ncbi:hypothetical protein FIU87_06115 [Bacillus sp. THAF10]|uniref:hypothetical protein n=1 Tax=Bacillus sp. THAF10 TaxID=2587848 RepID=UPI0012690216|nr:hypothetical protein [Bacillus sp. THAF10]QFT88209.1 hypothetical protein FIU87_06115 [Bacillus sp. THAF10]
MGDNTLKKKNQHFMEKAEYANESTGLKKDAKSVNRIGRHMEREQNKKNQKALQPAYEVSVNEHSFRVTGVQSEKEAIDKLSKWSAFHNMVNKLKENDEEVNIEATKVQG